MNKLNANQLRKSRFGLARIKQRRLIRHPVVLVLDNIFDTYNIGSFFRLADAIAAQKIYLCGPVVTPPNIKIHRSSVGTWKWIPWQHFDNSLDCVKLLQQQDYQIVSCELSQKSIPYNKAKYSTPIAIIAGNETNGVSQNILRMSDLIVEIPMYGINTSLNTLTATSIVSYHIISKINNHRTGDN